MRDNHMYTYSLCHGDPMAPANKDKCSDDVVGLDSEMCVGHANYTSSNQANSKVPFRIMSALLSTQQQRHHAAITETCGRTALSQMMACKSAEKAKKRCTGGMMVMYNERTCSAIAK